MVANAGVLSGQGVVVNGPGGLLVLSPGADAQLSETLTALVLHGEGPGVLADARTAASSVPGPFAILAQVRNGWGALVGTGLELRAEHIGYRRTHQGPAELTVNGAVRIAVQPHDSVNGAVTADLPPGRYPGAGVSVVLQQPIGDVVPIVDGVACGCGGFVHPLTLECPACGGQVLLPRRQQREPRPPVARLVMDDGRVIALMGDVVIGRRPSIDPEVMAGRMTALTLNDPERTVSRVHAQLTVAGWDLLLTDRNAENGTSVKPQGVASFTRLPAGACVRVLPGATIELGRRRIVIDA